MLAESKGPLSHFSQTCRFPLCCTSHHEDLGRSMTRRSEREISRPSILGFPHGCVLQPEYQEPVHLLEGSLPVAVLVVAWKRTLAVSDVYHNQCHRSCTTVYQPTGWVLVASEVSTICDDETNKGVHPLFGVENVVATLAT